MQTRNISTRIPAGVKDGQTLRLAGKGAAGAAGGPPGDLLVTVNVTPHPVFARKGDNLTVTLPVTFAEAALGASVLVPTLDGEPVTLKIPAGTPTGRTFRVRGRGIPRKSGKTGDLLVMVEVAVPQRVSGKAREALESYRDATADEPIRDTVIEQAARG
jgi:molecular chaperone DnaJ